jgi:hypothetical protein
MSTVFESQPGRVTAIHAENPRPFLLDLGGSEFLDCIATSVVIDHTVAAQVSLSLSNDVFITPFGDNPSTLLVSFILNGKDCDAPESSVQTFLNGYHQAKLGPYQNKYPRLFVVGGAAYEGYIIGCKANANTDGGQRMYMGSLSAIVWAING